MKKKVIYALGFFDGVHRGHQELLRQCRLLADTHNCDAGVVTFSSHPDTLVTGCTPRLLNTPQDRKSLLLAYGMDTVIELPFDETLMSTHWSDFLISLVEQDAAGFVCGEDFRFGAGGNGTAKKLAAFCQSRELPHAVIAQQFLNGIRISSTHIRALIEDGKIEQAEEFLGHRHILTGTVVSGRQLGRTLGIPTANILIPDGVVQPRHGVYACKTEVNGQEYMAVTNIGHRPTVGGHQTRAESWLLDFDGDLYGQSLTLQFCQFLRPEKKFDSLAQLQAEIHQNAAQTRKIFEKS